MLQYFGLLNSPDVGGMIPAIHFIRVDFPAPLCPAKEIRSFGMTVKVRSSNKTRGPNSTLMFFTASTSWVIENNVFKEKANS